MSRAIGFKVWSKKHNTYFELSGLHYEGGKIDGVFVISGTLAGIPNVIFLEPEDVALEQCTGLEDKNGKEIYTGDILEFDDEDGIWRASVVFERGLYGLDVHHPKQVKNPDGWDKDYDKVESRGWAVHWGYEESGTAFTYRTPLAKATIFRGSPEEYERSEQKKLCEKFGYGNYYVMAEVIGNIHENPELLEDK